jgi:sigma54-dependent transcription regulator
MSLAYDTRAQGLLRRIDFGTRSAGPPAEFVAQSPAMRKVLEMAAKIGPTDCTVLIEGEPSVGKESVARIIHRQSNRAGGPFMRVPCGGIPKSRLYEQLFGRAGNGSPKKNRTDRSFLTCAKGGTLFLDGISQLPLWAQIKLYDILQEEWRRCGNSAARHTCDRLYGLRPRSRRGLRPLPLEPLLLLEYREDSRAPVAISPGGYPALGRARTFLRQLRERPILGRQAASAL